MRKDDTPHLRSVTSLVSHAACICRRFGSKDVFTKWEGSSLPKLWDVRSVRPRVVDEISPWWVSTFLSSYGWPWDFRWRKKFVQHHAWDQSTADCTRAALGGRMGWNWSAAWDWCTALKLSSVRLVVFATMCPLEPAIKAWDLQRTLDVQQKRFWNRETFRWHWGICAWTCSLLCGLDEASGSLASLEINICTESFGISDLKVRRGEQDFIMPAPSHIQLHIHTFAFGPCQSTFAVPLACPVSAVYHRWYPQAFDITSHFFNDADNCLWNMPKHLMGETKYPSVFASAFHSRRLWICYFDFVIVLFSDYIPGLFPWSLHCVFILTIFVIKSTFFLCCKDMTAKIGRLHRHAADRNWFSSRFVDTKNRRFRLG